MTERDMQESVVDDLLTCARRQATPLPEDLFARITADADAVDAGRKTPAPRPPVSWLALLGSLLGGWPAAAGLGTAALAGLWIGVAQPGALVLAGLLPVDQTALLTEEETGETSYELADLMPGFGALGSED